MAGAATTAAALLAAVLAWAALAKTATPARRAATSASFAAIGLRSPRGLSVLVPIAELTVAVALLFRPELGALAALVLLAGFTAVLVRVLNADLTTGCGCFGAVAGQAVGPRDVARNGLLAGLAIVATGTLHPVRPPVTAAVLVAVVAGAAWGATVLLFRVRR